MTSIDKAELIVQFAAEKKGEDIVFMDMRETSAIFDWFVLIGANTPRKINAISNGIQKGLSKGSRVSPLHVEGGPNACWVLLDYEDVVVHIFHSEVRDFYELERLWSDAPIERFDSKCTEKTSQKR